jgi:preprotein translocase subunit Sss1
MSDIVAGMLIWIALMVGTTMLVVGVIGFLELLADFFVRVEDDED